MVSAHGLGIAGQPDPITGQLKIEITLPQIEAAKRLAQGKVLTIRQTIFGNDINDPSGRAATILNRTTTAHNLNTLNTRQGDIAEVRRTAIRSILFDTIHQDQGIGGAGHAKPAQINGWVSATTADQVNASGGCQHLWHRPRTAVGNILCSNHRLTHRRHPSGLGNPAGRHQNFTSVIHRHIVSQHSTGQRQGQQPACIFVLQHKCL